ncbi:MAG: LysR family transcriptional regulator [Rhodospirillaceae bacterium]|jgi:LysR family transcriptional regulator, nitrogen assimilation regulatory protein|nr:LysR family transcriptional regulator [Rhodospirillaceae bacterium]
MTIEIRDLRCFAEAARLGNISRAAASLRMPQPAVSRQISALERALGTDLFLRHGRGVHLTDAGELLFSRAVRILDELAAATAEMAAARNRPGGTVAIGTMPGWATLAAADLVERFRSRFPDTVLGISTGPGGDLLEDLAAGTIQAALLYDAQASRGLEVDWIAEEPLYLVGRAGEAAVAGTDIPFARLAELPLVIPRAGHPLRRVVDAAARKAGVALRPSVEMEAMMAIRPLLARGDMFTVLGGPMMRSLAAEGGLAAALVVEPRIDRKLAIVTASWMPLGEPARAAIAMLRSEVLRILRAET